MLYALDVENTPVGRLIGAAVVFKHPKTGRYRAAYILATGRDKVHVKDRTSTVYWVKWEDVGLCSKGTKHSES